MLPSAVPALSTTPLRASLSSASRTEWTGLPAADATSRVLIGSGPRTARIPAETGPTSWSRTCHPGIALYSSPPCSDSLRSSLPVRYSEWNELLTLRRSGPMRSLTASS